MGAGARAMGRETENTMGRLRERGREGGKFNEAGCFGQSKIESKDPHQRPHLWWEKARRRGRSIPVCLSSCSLLMASVI